MWSGPWIWDFYNELQLFPTHEPYYFIDIVIYYQLPKNVIISYYSIRSQCDSISFRKSYPPMQFKSELGFFFRSTLFGFEGITRRNWNHFIGWNLSLHQSNLNQNWTQLKTNHLSNCMAMHSKQNFLPLRRKNYF